MGDFLNHAYSSVYYDPVKAHEYYERTKKLKGRKSSQLSEEGRDVWAITKDNIQTEKKSTLDTTQKEHQKGNEEVKKQAAETRARITEKLKKVLESLTDKTQQKIDAIPKLPRGASEEEKKERKEKIAKIRQEGKSEKESEKLATTKTRETLANDVKSVISKARDAYKMAKADVHGNFEEIFQKEFDAILSTMPYVKKKKR